MSAFPAAVRRVIDAGRERGVEVAPTIYPEGTKTAADAAAAIGCAVSAIVKSLVFVVDEEPVVALVPGDLRLDAGKLASVFGAQRARRADLDTVRSATGFAAGGTPPFGHSGTPQVVADPRLRRHETVWAAAGTPSSVFPVAPDDLAAAAGARWVEITEA